jgi:DNA polymerase III delta subunit
MNFYAPDERVLVQYIYEMAKALGLVIDSESAKLLMDLIGTDFAAIHQELEKIKTFLGTKTRITTDTVLISCGFSKESSIEDLIKETFNRNRIMSLSNLYRLQKDRTFPSIIISSLANSGLALLQVKLGASMKMLKIGQKRFDLLVRQNCLWEQEELEKFISALARIDKKIKTGYPEPYVMLEVLLAKSGKDSEYSRRYVV